jgi:hypothetical protein
MYTSASWFQELKGNKVQCSTRYAFDIPGMERSQKKYVLCTFELLDFKDEKEIWCVTCI